MNKNRYEYGKMLSAEGLSIQKEWIAGSGHLIFQCEYKGRTMRVILSATPSDQRSMANKRAQIRAFKRGVDQCTQS